MSKKDEFENNNSNGSMGKFVFVDEGATSVAYDSDNENVVSISDDMFYHELAQDVLENNVRSKLAKESAATESGEGFDDSDDDGIPEINDTFVEESDNSDSDDDVIEISISSQEYVNEFLKDEEAEESEDEEVTDEDVDEPEDEEVTDEDDEESEDEEITDEDDEELEDEEATDEDDEESEDEEITDEDDEESEDEEATDEDDEESEDEEITDEDDEESENDEITDEDVDEPEDEEITDEDVDEPEDEEVTDEDDEESEDEEATDEDDEESEDEEITDEDDEESEDEEIIDEDDEESEDEEITDEDIDEPENLYSVGEAEPSAVGKVDIMGYLSDEALSEIDSACGYVETNAEPSTSSDMDTTQVYDPVSAQDSYDVDSGYVDIDDDDDVYKETPKPQKKREKRAKRRKKRSSLKSVVQIASLLAVVAGLTWLISRVAFPAAGSSNKDKNSSDLFYGYSSSATVISFDDTSDDGTSPEDEFNVSSLKVGDRGDLVLKAQRALSSLGYLEFTDVNGTYDNTTKQAVEEFQKTNGIQATGVIEKATYYALFSSNASSPTTVTTDLPTTTSAKITSTQTSTTTRKTQSTTTETETTEPTTATTEKPTTASTDTTDKTVTTSETETKTTKDDVTSTEPTTSQTSATKPTEASATDKPDVTSKTGSASDLSEAVSIQKPAPSDN